MNTQEGSKFPFLAFQVIFNAPVPLTFAVLYLVAYRLGMSTNGWTTKKFLPLYTSPATDLSTYVRFIGYTFIFPTI